MVFLFIITTEWRIFMKKFLLAVLGVAVIFSGCGNKKQDTEVNYFNGAGSLKSDSGRYATGVIYDDNTYYLKTSRGYVYTDKDKCYSICLDATCSHSGTGCIADENNNYFILHGVIYTVQTEILRNAIQEMLYIKMLSLINTTQRNIALMPQILMKLQYTMISI